MDDVRKHLREAAEAHQPDRDAIWARVQRGMADSTDADRARRYRRRRQASWIKVTLAGVAGVGVLGLGGLAVAAGVQQRSSEHPAPVIGSPTSRPADATPTPRGSAGKTPAQVPSTPGPSTPRHSATPTPTPTADGPITAHGEVDAHSTIYWEQNTLTVDVSQPLSSFIVELRIAQSPGVQNTGTWLTAAPDDYTVTVTPADGFLVYRWTLKPGRTVPAARQLFGAQFNHSTGKRDASKDTFLVEAPVGSRTVAVRGGFTSGG